MAGVSIGNHEQTTPINIDFIGDYRYLIAGFDYFIFASILTEYWLEPFELSGEKMGEDYSPASLSKGAEIYHYRIIEKIGSGGMGEVYLAEDTKLNRRVALKFLPFHFASDKTLKTRFISEARAAAKLNQPNIITIHEVGEYESRPFFVMEYIEGKPLSEIIGTEEMTYDRAVDITLQICEGLKEAHKAGIVHRDIKSANIIIDKNGRCRILDFGLAAVQSDERLTQADSLLGTVEYMSPEQVKGEKVDYRSDIFSLGVLLFEMLAGQLPFKGDYVAGIVYSIINETPRPLANYNRGIPEVFQTIIDKILQKDPRLRYQKIEDFQADLKKLKAEQATVSIHPLPATAKPIRRILIPTSVIAVIVLLFLIFKPWRVVVEPDQPAVAAENRLAIMYFDNLADPEDPQKLGEIATNLLITDLSESRSLNVVSSQRLYDILKLLGREGEKRIDKDIASQVAHEAKAKWMLSGSILQLEPAIIITTQLVDVESGNSIATQRINGTVEDNVFSLIDKITVEIKKDLSIPAAGGQEADRPVAEVTTSSPEAYKFYIEGLEYLDKIVFRAEAKASFEQALKHDSTFAMAYYQLSKYGRRPEREEMIDRALKYSNRATRKEKQYIKARVAIISDDDNGYIEELERIIETYPDEKDAHYALGLYYKDTKQYDKCILHFKKAIEIDPLLKTAYNELAYIYDSIDDFENAIWAINKYISIAPDEANPYDSRGDIYRSNGQMDKALESYRKALEIRPDFLETIEKLSRLYLLFRHYASAESLCMRLCLNENLTIRSQGRKFLALIPMHQGKFTEALKVLDDGIAADRLDRHEKWDNIHKYGLKAMIYRQQGNMNKALQAAEETSRIIRKTYPEGCVQWKFHHAEILAEFGEFQRAEKLAEEMKRCMEESNEEVGLFNWYTLGCIEFSRRNLESAELYFQKALEDNDRFYMRYMLGRTYLEMEKLQEAVEIFQGELNDLSETMAFFAIRAVKTHYYLAIAYERSGWTNKAIEQYEEFLDIWKDADPGIEQIDDAKARLARLKQET